MNEEFQAEDVTNITLNIRLDDEHIWHLACPQWKFCQSGRNITQMVALLMSEIEAHTMQRNENQPSLDAAENIRRKLRKNLPRVMPDDGTRTPRVSLWQTRA